MQELGCSLALGEEICNLLFRGYEGKLNGAMLNMMSNEVTINLKMFSSFVKNIIEGKFLGTFTINRERFGLESGTPKS